MSLEPIRTFSGAVGPADCDVMGHMNIASYIRMFDQATQLFFAHFGDGPSLRQAGQGWADIRIEVDYRAEAIAGDLVFVTSELVSVATSSLVHTHRMCSLIDGALLAEARFVTVAFDLHARKKTHLPEPIRSRLVDRVNLATHRDTP